MKITEEQQQFWDVLSLPNDKRLARKYIERTVNVNTFTVKSYNSIDTPTVTMLGPYRILELRFDKDNVHNCNQATVKYELQGRQTAFLLE